MSDDNLYEWSGDDYYKDMNERLKSDGSFQGTTYQEGVGRVNRDGKPIKTKAWNGERLYHIETHQSDNPNIPSGYVRVAIGIPCPESGCEDAVVRYSIRGEPAIWDAGDVYMVKK